MGLFTRKEAMSSRRQAQRPRPSVSSEAQAASMRVKARRRLAGAVALVLAAVIVLPMLLDGEPRPVPTGIQIDVPKKTDPFNPDLSASQISSGTLTSAVTEQSNGSASTGEGSATTQVNSPASTTDASASGQAGTAPSGQEPRQQPQAPTATSTTPETAVKPQAKPDAQDSTAVAMAILEGRKPPTVSTANARSASGGFLVQIASYSAKGDADSRRDKLASQGITNAFVETASVNGKPTYRLRVGPFESRDAAQAAQTRLRTLGYGDGMILTK